MWISKQQAILGSVLGIITLVFTLGVWWPQMRELSEQRTRIDVAQEKLGPTFNQAASVSSREHDVVALREALDASSRYVPREQELAELLRSLTQAVQDQGLTEQQVEAREVRQYKNYGVIPADLQISGSFDAVYSVIEAIENLPRLVRLDAMNLRVAEPRRGEAATGQVHASLRLSTFFGGGMEEARK